MQNPAARFLRPIAPPMPAIPAIPAIPALLRALTVSARLAVLTMLTMLTMLALLTAGCSVSQLGLADDSVGSEPVPGIEDPGSPDGRLDSGGASDPVDPDDRYGDGGSTTRSETADGEASAPDPTPSSDGQTITVRLSTDPAAVYRAGSCYGPADPGAGPAEVGCDRPHTIEVYAVGQLAGEPGAPFLALDAARDLCDADFRALTGVGIGLATVLDRSVVRPSEETWQAGERDVICYVLYPDPVERPLATIDPLRGFGRVSVYGLRAGDCLVDFVESETSFKLVVCDDPHDAEVFAELRVEDGDYPGDLEIDRLADELCFGQNFQDFVGVGYQDSALASVGSRPTVETWAAGHRSVSCILTDELVRTGSLAGSGL